MEIYRYDMWASCYMGVALHDQCSLLEFSMCVVDK